MPTPTLTDREVGMSHDIADLERDLARYRRVTSDSIDLLVDALAALRNGDTDVTEEFVDRATLALQVVRSA